MNGRADIPWNDLKRLFSVVICFDESMRIIYASDTVHKYLPEVKDGPVIDEVFAVLRPGKLKTFSDALASLDSLCLMTATNGRFAIRGQLLTTIYDNQKAMCLCGAPWLFWISSNCPDISLSLGDFAAQDVQLDQLFFMTTEKMMVADLENLNTELIEAKDKLQEAHDAQRRFFAQMSHEMRTPLNGVVSALSLLETNSLEDRQRQLVGLAQSSSRNLMDVINYVLDLSKLELAGEDGETVFDLPKLIRSTIDILGAKAREKSLELTLEMDPGNPGSYTEVPAQLPVLVASQGRSPELFLRLTFVANIDLFLSEMYVVVETDLLEQHEVYVPIQWSIAGCPDGAVDLVRYLPTRRQSPRLSGLSRLHPPAAGVLAPALRGGTLGSHCGHRRRALGTSGGSSPIDGPVSQLA